MAAARYLGGGLRLRRRRSFEAHVLECEACWREVDVARRGRSVAEAARELAPQPLRERIRTAVFAVPLRSTRRMVRPAAITVLTGIIVLAVVTLVFTRGPSAQDPVIAAAAASGGGELIVSERAAPELPQRLGDLRLIDTRSGTVEGLPVIQHLYRDGAGHVVSVLQAPTPFPVAAGADHAEDGRTWTTEIDGIALLCAERPVPSLVAGNDPTEVRHVGRLLGLH
ncbi:MAG: hypothetical protein WD770_10265 [Actinomycetota bacterium]